MKLTPKFIRDLKNRKEYAFRAVYDEYYRLIYYVAVTIVKDEDTAQDIMQDTFVTFMNHIEEYEDDGHLKQYLTSIARNLAINVYQARKRKKEIPLDTVGEIPISDDRSKVEVILTLQHALTEEEADLVMMKIIYENSFREIAEEKNLTIGTVQAKYYKALEKLRKYFMEGDVRK